MPKGDWNKRTREEIEEIVNGLGYALLDEYMLKGKRKVIIQDRNNYKYDVYLGHVIDLDRNINFIGKSNSFTIENISLWLKINNKTFDLYGKNFYSDANKPELRFFCLICKQIFYMGWGSISRGHNCPFCSGKKAGKYNNLAYLRPDLLDEWDYENNTIFPENVREFSHKIVSWICSNCNYRWTASINNRTGAMSGCPKCSFSKGENFIFLWTNKNKIISIPHHSFSDCRNIYPLPFDFYLPDYNLCVEYHGPQHYEPVDFAGRGVEWAKSEFKKIKKRDKIKLKYCKDNNIPLLVIPYWDFDNIENILTEKLKL